MTSVVTRPASPRRLLANPVVAVLRARHAREYSPVIDALVKGGVTSVELTLSTEGVFDLMPALLAEFGDHAEVGVGTIADVAEAELALDRGARFIVTPTVNTSVIEAAVRRGVPVYPGGLTPTELLTGWRSGATAVKLFPASAVGPGYLGQLRGPFPDLRVMPSGGIDVADAPAWIAAGAHAVSLGGPLLQDAFADGDLAALTQRATRVSSAVAEAASRRDKA